MSTQPQPQDHQTLVSVDRDDAVLRLTLQNPPAHLLSVAVMEFLVAELDLARDDKAVRVIVIAAAGKLFSAGHDLKGNDGAPRRRRLRKVILRTNLRALLASDAGDRGSSQACHRGRRRHRNGRRLPAGRLLRSRTRLGSVQVRRERHRRRLVLLDSAVALTRNVSRKRAMEMLLTGEMINAATALEFGLVNRVVPAEALAEAASEMARVIAAKSPAAVSLGKQAVRMQAPMDLAEAYQHASRVMVKNMLADDAAEGISAFLEKRQPKWRS